MRMMISGLAIACGLLAAGAGETRAVDLLTAGQAKARIVLPAEPTPTEQFAAEELGKYLAEISGAKLPVGTEPSPGDGPRILIGATSPAKPLIRPLAEKDPEAFRVQTLNGDLLLAGATDRATLYAVYDFLEEELGCRWLGPGPDWETVPKRPSIEVPDVDRVESPAMKYRFLRMTTTSSSPWAKHCLSWAVKQKINIASGWPPEELAEPIARRGGFRAWMGPHLLIPNALPPEEHFQQHPEWYALVDGRRRMLKKHRTQLCTTNPEVVRKVAEAVGQTFDARPEMDFIGMGQADGTAFCECPDCTALDSGEIWKNDSRQRPVITRRWLSFVNAVARRLAETHPGKKVYTLAYHQTFRPPDPEVIRPAANVMIQVVNSRPNYVCFVHRFEKESCPHHEAFREGLAGWLGMTPAGVLIYEYDPHSTFCAMPYPAAHKFVDDIRYLHRQGVVGYEGQSTTGIWGTYGINHYAIAKTTWDPSVDAETLVRDYCDHAFGAASAPMQRFVETIEEGLASADHITDGIWTYMTADVMAAARRHLDEAHAKADTEAVKRRLRAYEVGFHYGELGSQAWRTAQKALAERDAEGLAKAIGLAAEAARYCDREQAKDPHYAAAPGKLTKVHLRRWRAALEKLRKTSGGE